MVKLTTLCQGHGGPLSAENISLLEGLNEKEVIAEVTLLKATVANEIKLRKRIPDPANSGKFKMEKIPMEQLKRAIRNVLKPEKDGACDDIESVLAQLFLDTP